MFTLESRADSKWGTIAFMSSKYLSSTSKRAEYYENSMSNQTCNMSPRKIHLYVVLLAFFSLLDNLLFVNFTHGVVGGPL